LSKRQANIELARPVNTASSSNQLDRVNGVLIIKADERHSVLTWLIKAVLANLHIRRDSTAELS